MCGIAFLIAPERAAEDLKSSMDKALECMAHRGPDDWGVEVDTDCIVGHRRLSIIDLAASLQPMASPDGRYLLSFNGEIYTYKELRQSLEGDWEFRTNGDTEVLLAGLILHGVDFLPRMEGMWAFALWDKVEQSLLLSRDRMGKKPLYYVARDNNFGCASHLPSLRALDSQEWSEDTHSTADYFKFGYNMPGYTAYEGVKEVLPGHYLYWEKKNCKIRQKAYWELQPQAYKGSLESGILDLKQRIITATERRLVADVEVGAFLSGGVDSSLIVALAKERIGEYLKTFTIGFRDKTFDERKYARKVAEFIKTDHHEQVFDDLNHNDLEQLLLEHVGQPFADPSLLPTTLVSTIASDYVKVALAGDGGDELFCGYQRYQARMLLRWYTRLPKFFRDNINRAVRILPEPMSHHSNSLIKKAHLFTNISERLDAETPYFAPLMFQPGLLRNLFPDSATTGHEPPNIPEQVSPNDLQRMMLADVSIYLPQDILSKVDRASMAKSLEVRAPFLDSDVIRLALSFPVEWHRKMRPGGKLMLKRAFENMLPSSVWERRKQGFGVPLHAWFRGDLGEKLLQLVEEDSGPLDPSVVRTMHHDHKNGRLDHGSRLWLIYVYLLWRQNLK